MYSCTRGLFRRKCSLNDCTVLYFSGIKLFRELLKLPHDDDDDVIIIMAIRAGRNVLQKEAEKKLKYKSLGIEIQ
jgi:hypothetical protein